jgi:hypothetical protein
MSPFLWLSHSLARVTATSLAVLVCAVFAAVATARYVEHQSTSPVVDLLLITAVMAALLAAAVLQALAAGELLLRRPWRGLFLRGERADVAYGASQAGETDLIVASRAVSSRRDVLLLSVLTIGLLALDVYLVNRVTASFFDRYVESGYLRSALRGASPAEKEKLLLEIADRGTPDLADWTQAELLPRVASPDAEERGAALVALWWVGTRMNRSADILNQQGGREDAWEYALAIWLREHAVGPVSSRLAASAEPERVAAIRALGSFRARQSVDTLAALTTSREPAAVRQAAVLALGQVASPEAALALLGAMADLRTDIRALDLAVWALGECGKNALISSPRDLRNPDLVEPSEGIRRVVEWLSVELSKLPPSTQCIAATLAADLADARLGPPLTALFDAPESTIVCASVELEQAAGRPFVLSRGEPLRMLALRALANIAVGNPEVERWVAERSRDPGVEERYRKELANMALLIEQAAGKGGEQ